MTQAETKLSVDAGSYIAHFDAFKRGPLAVVLLHEVVLHATFPSRGEDPFIVDRPLAHLREEPYMIVQF